MSVCHLRSLFFGGTFSLKCLRSGFLRSDDSASFSRAFRSHRLMIIVRIILDWRAGAAWCVCARVSHSPFDHKIQGSSSTRFIQHMHLLVFSSLFTASRQNWIKGQTNKQTPVVTGANSRQLGCPFCDITKGFWGLSQSVTN